MVNPAFQALLNRIKSKQSKKSNAFVDFLKATRTFLKKLFNVKTANNSVLTQAVAVISNKIYSTDYQAKKPATPPPPPAGAPSGGSSSSAPGGSTTPLTDEEKIKAISQNTPIKDMPQELVDLLDEEYKKITKASRGTYSKTGFAAFVKNAPKASSVIEKWKRDEIKKLKGPAPTTGGKKGASTKDDDDDEPTTITDDQRQALYNLGYSRRDIDGYEDEDGELFQLVEPEDIDEIIKLGLRRSRKVAAGNFEEADQMIEDVREKLAEKEFPEDKVTDKGYTDENGVNWPRVSELLKKNFVNKDGTTRGTILDTVYREFMMNEINSVQELTARLDELSVDPKGKRLFTYSKGFVVNLYDSMQEVHDFISEMGYKIVADIPTLWGEIDGRRAGTIDFLIYNEDKEFAIVDLKTSTVNLRRAYEDPSKDTYEYQKGHTTQQNGYRELFGQRTGLTPTSLFVLPLLLKKNKSGTYDGIKTLPSKSGSLMLPISMDQDIYGLTGVAKSAAAFVSAEPKPTTKPPKKKKKKSAPPKTTTDTFVPLVVPMDDVDAQVAELEKQKKEELNFYTVDKLKTEGSYGGYIDASGNIYPQYVNKFNKTVEYANKIANILSQIGEELPNKNGKRVFRVDVENQEFRVTVNFDGTLEFKNPEFNISLQPFAGTEDSNTALNDLKVHLETVGREVIQKETGSRKNSSYTFKEGIIEDISDKFDAKIAALKNGAATTTTTKPPVTTKVDIEVAKDLLRQLIRGKVITEFTPDEQKILGDPSIITQELRDTLTKEFNDSKPEVVKGSVIRMTNGELVQVKNITKGKITVVPLMDDTAAEDVIDEADITDRQIVASPAKKKTVKTTPDVDTKEVIDDSVTQANGLAASKDDQAKLANEAKEMTPEERLAAVKEELRNRCNTGTKKKK
jgi:hypothetical protein